MTAAASIVTVAVLLAIKVATLIGARSRQFDALPRPNQID